MSEVVLRCAQSDDLAGVQTCVEAAFGRYLPRMDKPPAPMLDDYATLIAQRCVTVVSLDEQILAVMVLQAQEDALLLETLAVSPAYQGQGLGLRCLQHAEAQAHAAAYAKVVLYTHACMHESLAFYKKLAYQETGRLTEQGYARVYLQKDLA